MKTLLSTFGIAVLFFVISYLIGNYIDGGFNGDFLTQFANMLFGGMLLLAFTLCSIIFYSVYQGLKPA